MKDPGRRGAAAAAAIAAAVLALSWAGRSLRGRDGLQFPRRRAAAVAGARDDRSGARREDDGGLSAPEPVLTAAAKRLFSDPTARGAVAGADPETLAASGAGPRLTGASVDLPSGGSAPTASALAAARRDASPERGPAAPGPGAAAGPSEATAPGASSLSSPSGAGASGRRPPPGPSAGEGGMLPSEGAKLADAARGQRALNPADGGNMSVKAGLMSQASADAKLDEGLREAISGLGPSPSPAAVAKAAEGVLKDQGLKKDDVDLETAVARAQAPPQPPVAPETVAATVQKMVAENPLTPTQLEQLRREEKSPPPLRGPPPKGAIDAYRKYGDAFEKAEKDFGVKPQHILGILGVETGYGRNTGSLPAASTLLAISQRTNADGTPTRAAKQASHDLAALGRLKANGELTGSEPVNYAGAMGIPQFLVSSWEAYARSPTGGKRNPFDFGTAAYSVGSYLKSNGYGKSVEGSVFRYNHSQAYVDKVLGLSAQVEQGIKPLKPAAP